MLGQQQAQQDELGQLAEAQSTTAAPVAPATGSNQPELPPDERVRAVARRNLEDMLDDCYHTNPNIQGYWG